MLTALSKIWSYWGKKQNTSTLDITITWTGGVLPVICTYLIIHFPWFIYNSDLLMKVKNKFGKKVAACQLDHFYPSSQYISKCWIGNISKKALSQKFILFTLFMPVTKLYVPKKKKIFKLFLTCSYKLHPEKGID